MPGLDGLVKNGQSLFINVNSGAEVARQMNQEALITEVMGGLLTQCEDLPEAQCILDVYCGAGSWALEMAFHYPQIDVVGIDSNENMVKYARAQARVQGLRNVQFFTMDPLAALKFPDQIFDVVNARFLSFYLKRQDWPRVVAELVRVTRPQGMIRLTDFDEPGTTNGPACEKLKQLYIQAMVRNEQSLHPLPDSPHCGITPMLGHFLRQAGCEQIQEKAHIMNYGAGSKAISEHFYNLKVLYKLGQPFLLAQRVTTQEELDRLYQQMITEMLSDNFSALWYFLSTWGYAPARTRASSTNLIENKCF